MTTAEMIESFGLNYASEINSSVPGWEDSEILHFLNQAQDDVVRELYNRSGGLELRSLVKGTTLSSSSTYSTGITNAKEFDNTASDYLYYLGSRSKLTRTDPTMTAEWIDNQLISPSDAHKFIQSSTNTPWFKNPVVFWEETDDLVVFYDAYTTALTDIFLQYIKEPVEITNAVDCELREDLHQDVVDRAVTVAIEILQNPRIQTQPAVSK